MTTDSDAGREGGGTRAATDDLASWCELARELGAGAATPLAPALVVTADWVRLKCRFGCDDYGQSRTCPPHSPTPDQTRRLLDEYSRAILLGTGPHTGYDDAGRHSARLRRTTTDLERRLFLAGYHQVWSLGCGPCETCPTCDLGTPCVDPEHARPSLESCGVDVFTTVRNAGWRIDVVQDHEDEYRFFSLVLVD